MDTAVLAILKENTIAFGITSVFVLISFALKTVTSLIDFHEEVFVKRYLKRLSSFTNDIDANSITFRYINVLKENEVFRIASGIKSYPEKARMLMEIYLLGVASKSELKRLSQYCEPENNKVSITVDWLDKVIFIYSFISILVFFSFGVYIGLSNLMSGKFGQIVAGLVIMYIFMLTSIITGRDYRGFRILKRVRDRLIELNMLTNPDNSIEWNITLWPRRPEIRSLQDAMSTSLPTPPQKG